MRRFYHWLESGLLRKLLTVTLCINIILYVIFAHILYYSLRETVESGIQQMLTQESTSIADAIDAYFYGKSDLISLLSRNYSVNHFLNSDTSREDVAESDYYPNIMASLSAVSEIDPDIANVWVASLQGNYVLYHDGNLSDEEYDITSRPWYAESSKISNESQVWFSSTTKSYLTGEQTIMILKPVFGKQQIVGFVGMNIYLRNFPDIMERISSIDCDCLLIGQDGTVIYSETADYVTKNIDDIDDALIREAASQMLSTGESNKLLKAPDKAHYISYSSIPQTGWSVAIYLDTAEIERTMSLFNILFAINIGVAILVWSGATYFILRKSLQSFPKIIQTVSRIADGDYSVRIHSDSTDEIGRIANAIDAMVEDLDDKSKMIENYTHFDTLTGLPNRRMLLNELDLHLKAASAGLSKLAVCCIDLDDFKWVNDTLGHAFGDEILLRLTELLTSCKRNADVIARFGGDEFMIIMPGISDEGVVQKYFDRVLSALERPLSVLDRELYLRFTCGVSVYPNDGTTSDELIKNSDMAMYNAKAHGKNRIEFYDCSVQQNLTQKARINQELEKALERNEFSIHYQPIVRTKDRSVYSVEALVRWQNAELGMIPPSEFIPIAEETGSIIKIGTWILRKACQTHKTLCEIYGNDLIMSVNISPEQMKKANFIDVVKSVLYETGINPQLLQLEITEGVLINFIRNANDTITQLCNLGIKIALDDFGTGYSSLSYLKHLPIDVLKIDKSFVDEIVRNKKDYSITGSIIGLVHNLGITTVAEGVETAEQFSYLAEMSCDYIQGYLMSRPLSEGDVINYLKEHRIG